jgi:hypothetical protein
VITITARTTPGRRAGLEGSAPVGAAEVAGIGRTCSFPARG